MFQAGLAWCTIGIYCSAFLEPHQIHKASAKHCSDNILFCIDNWNLFLQCNAAIFIPMSGGKMDHLGHLPPQIHTESHYNVNLYPVFYLKAYLRCTESFRMKPDGYHVTSLFWVTIGSIGLSVLKPFLLG